jgi:two-component system OmpR family response regulator
MDLTPREAGVLEVLLRRAGRVASKSGVIEALALADPSALELLDPAIEVIVHRLRRKIEGSGIEIHTVRGFGYLLRETGG